MKQRVLDLPDVDGRVVGGSITEAARSMHLTVRIHQAGRASLGVVARPCVDRSAKHGEKGQSRVDDETGIVGDDQRIEPRLSRDPPWLGLAIILFPALRIVGVQEQYRDDVDAGDGDGHLGSQDGMVDVGGNGEGRAKGSISHWRRWYRTSVRNEAELGKGEVDLRSRHGGRNVGDG
jgi:hypothetical protein